jgi:hypothetical protein
MSYIIEDTCIEHDGGKIGVEVEIDNDQSVIRFGNSFTLRLDENNIDKLRRILHSASCELALGKNA